MQRGRRGRPDAASRQDADRGRRSRGGFDFLGYHFERGYRWPRQKSLKKLKDTIRAKTRRTNGHSLPSSSPTSTARCGAGLDTSSTAKDDVSSRWTAGCGCGCAASCASAQGRRGRGARCAIISAGRSFFAEQGLFSLAAAHAAGLSVLSRGKPLNWRAGCGRSARPVRREGEPNQSSLPTPIRALVRPTYLRVTP